MTIPRADPPLHADEGTMLRAWLDFHRATLRRKADGLDAEQLDRALPPSTMTLGGMLKHLALVETNWFDAVLRGEAMMPPFDAVDWDADFDWDWHSAVDDRPDELRRLLDAAIERADRVIDEALAGPDGLDTASVLTSTSRGEPFTLRWILCHMVEEYARHNGHADLIREAIDGEVGE
ncbi:DinB family protein [Nocardioides panacisoli]|uniref:DinB family protein n=1 Tax=Nocardioides panacisoli TaxID=627624 RepID=UPI001C624D68|nr:DinB family protein [Nocardioides panacisoli]QYJ04141.1 DinB family protein [Nocardioides panacisoli]